MAPPGNGEATVSWTSKARAVQRQIQTPFLRAKSNPPRETTWETLTNGSLCKALDMKDPDQANDQWKLLPSHSMYAIVYAYIGVVLGVNVGIYGIHGVSGL